MSSTVRIVCHERDDAHAAAEVLAAEGYVVLVERDRFHGEDDDEDHAWSVVVAGAPDARLEQVADAHDGWLDAGDAGGAGDSDRAGDSGAEAPLQPPPLPTSPRRFKRARRPEG